MRTSGWGVALGAWVFLACGLPEGRAPQEDVPAERVPEERIQPPPEPPSPDSPDPAPAEPPQPPAAPVCTPQVCGGAGRHCGTVSDGCGAPLDCGACAPGLACSGGSCVPADVTCEPRAADVELGSALPVDVWGSPPVDFNRENPSCSAYAAVDTTYAWTAPEAGTFVIDTVGSTYHGVLLAVQRGLCPQQELACDRDSRGAGYSARALVSLAAGEQVRIVVDGAALGINEHALHIQRAAPEACGNGHDDDGDGAVDCTDADCAGAAACEPRACAAVDLGTQVPVELGAWTDAERGRFPTACAMTYAPSRAHLFTPPRSGRYVFGLTTNTWDNEILGGLSVLASCGGAELACIAATGARQELTVQLEAGVPVLVVVRAMQAYTGVGGGYRLVIREPAL